ncbi:MAG: Tricarboxylate transport sensor protein TctE, partial [bacterium]|nr:Tricarboxylate transport sensor protein TctE [bacterium]
MTVERQRRRLGGVLLVSFGTIAAIVALSNLVANWHAQRARVEVRRGLSDAFASVEQVSRIGRDLDRERLLMDTHIAERDRFGMARVEARVDHVERDLYGATAAYQALIVSAGERQVWRSVESDLAALRPMIADVLALSSKNRDADARQYLEWVDARFGRVNADLARLNDSNRADVLGVLTRADREQHASQLLSAVLALIAIVLVVGVGGAATRMVGQREQQLLHYAARLETQNRELDAFAGRVAHDLRGPLTTMNLAASRIMEQLPTEASAGLLMKRGVARMERLIHDLLALS